MVMKVEEEEYVQFSDRVGLRLSVHDSDELSVPQEDGLYIDPGYYTTIIIRKVIPQYL